MGKDPKIIEISTDKPRKTNVVTGDNCLRCCQNGATYDRLQTVNLIGDFIRSLVEAERETIDLSVPDPDIKGDRLGPYAGIGLFVEIPKGPIVSPEVYKIRKLNIPGRPDIPQIPQPGKLVQILAAALALVSASRVNSVTETATDILERLQLALDNIPTATANFTCEECCRNALLSQKNPRQFVEERVKKRV